MESLAEQLETIWTGLGRYLGLALSEQPITATAVKDWLFDTFAAGIGFTQLSFFIFFPVCVLAYYCIPRLFKNAWLLVCSLFFYYLCTITEEQAHPEFLLLLCGCILVNWLLALFLERAKGPLRRVLLAAGIVASLGLLVYFKYVGFFAQVAHAIAPAIFRWDGSAFSIFLPIGISFYLFLSIGYLVDVYRKTRKAEKNLINYALFVSFFAHIVSGPIDRSDGLLAQLNSPRPYDHALLNEGLRQMVWGYFKKLVIAGNAAGIADVVFATPSRFNGFELLCGSLFYTLQIYADFSGYTDIATGAGKMLGLKLAPNFDKPYFSRSIGEFWDRWHISLSSWFLQYLYIPLGGSRKGTARACLNALLTFTLSGLWHGAAYTYLVWGLLHGIMTALSRLTKPLRQNLRTALRLERIKFLCDPLRWLWTFCFVNFAWIFFRADSLETAFTFIGRLGVQLWPTLSDPAALSTSLTYIGFYKYNGPALLACTAFLFLAEAVCYKTSPEKALGRVFFPVRLVFLYLVLLAILFFGQFGASGWIYAAY